MQSTRAQCACTMTRPVDADSFHWDATHGLMVDGVYRACPDTIRDFAFHPHESRPVQRDPSNTSQTIPRLWWHAQLKLYGIPCPENIKAKYARKLFQAIFENDRNLQIPPHITDISDRLKTQFRDHDGVVNAPLATSLPPPIPAPETSSNLTQSLPTMEHEVLTTTSGITRNGTTTSSGGSSDKLENEMRSSDAQLPRQPVKRKSRPTEEPAAKRQNRGEVGPTIDSDSAPLEDESDEHPPSENDGAESPDDLVPHRPASKTPQEEEALPTT